MASLSGQQIITRALSDLGLVEQGGAPSVSDSTFALDKLNDIWESWSVNEDFIYEVAATQFALTGATASYPIGPSATAPFNVARPARIYGAAMVATVGSGANRSQLHVVSAPEYYAHHDLAAAATSAEELYPDYADSSSDAMTLYLWPVPSCPTVTKLELQYGVIFTVWTLAGAYQIPPGYAEALRSALAWGLLPSFGVAVQQQIAEVVRENGLKAMATLAAANAFNRQRPSPMLQQPAPGAQSPVTPGGAQAFRGLQPGT